MHPPRRWRAGRRRTCAAAGAGLAVTAAVVLAGARDLTADYVKGREQFGRVLAEFQAVALQMADVYVASRTLDLAADNAVWRVATGSRPTTTSRSPATG